MGAPASTRGDPKVTNAAFLAGRMPDGIVWVTIRGGAFVDEASSREVNLAIRELADELPCRILCDISAPHRSDSSARKFGASRESVEVTGKLALLVRSPVARMAGNAFLLARRPAYPTRLFTNEADAIAWLTDPHD